jgi:hypothetical protein
MIAGALAVLEPKPSAHALEIGHYPGEVQELTAGHSPFSPADTSSSHIFALIRLKEAGSREVSGAGIEMKIEILGKKLLLLDTAAKGLLLKNRNEVSEDSVRAPEWIRPGPGIQTGIFRLFPQMSNGAFRMNAVVAELFWEKGFQGIDGILSTEVLKSWVVSLNLPGMRMMLLPPDNYKRHPDWELPAALADNWWIVPVDISGRYAAMLIDTG